MLPYILSAVGGFLVASGIKGSQSFSEGGSVEGRIEKLKAELDSAYDVYLNVFDEEERAEFVSTIQDKIETYQNLIEEEDDEYVSGVIPILNGFLDRINKPVGMSIYDKVVQAVNKRDNQGRADFSILKESDIQRLVDAGYNESDILAIYVGVKTLLPYVVIDNEIGDISGLFAIREEVVPEYINLHIEKANESLFELGLKYPHFEWDDIFRKYNVKTEGKEISVQSGNYKEVFTIFEGDDFILGTMTKRFKIENGVENEEKSYTISESGIASKKGGYWGIVSSKKSVIVDVAKMILSIEDGYVKDMEIFVNGLGGVQAADIKNYYDAQDRIKQPVPAVELDQEEPIDIDIDLETTDLYIIEWKDTRGNTLYQQSFDTLAKIKKEIAKIKKEGGRIVEIEILNDVTFYRVTEDIDLAEVEASARFYTDEKRWSEPPTVSKFEKEIERYQNLKTELDNKEIKPSQIIGTGYKPQYARKLAYRYIKEKIMIARRAIEILKEQNNNEW